MKTRFQFTDTLAGSRRELQRQFQLIMAMAPGAAAGNVEALHDLRVALRRLRVLLRALAEPLARTEAAALERRWQRFTGGLSPLRDADVWRGLLGELPGVTPAFRRRVVGQLRRERARPADLLKGSGWARLKHDTKRLLARPLPAALAKAGRGEILDALRRAWKQGRARAAKLAHDRRLADMENAHKLRIACRRVRYLAEFFALAAEGRKTASAWQGVAGRYRALQNALGRTHDADVLLEFLRDARLRPPVAVVQALRKRRAKGLAQFKKAWKQIDA